MDYVAGAQGEAGGKVLDWRDKTYDYTYPYGLDLKPGSALSKKICKAVYDRAELSYRRMSSRHKSWRQIDRVLTAYIPLDEEEKKVKSKDYRKPVTIVVPYTYATLETLLTYLVDTFLSGEIFRYEGTGPEDQIGGVLLGKLISQQCEKAKVALSLHTMFRDALAYSVGSVACSWERKLGKRTIRQDTGFYGLLGKFMPTGRRRQEVETVLYEGNTLKNIDPYCYLPDPSVSVHQLQDGEFSGWLERTNLMNLLSTEMTSDDIFNVRYLKHCGGKTSLIQGDQSLRGERFNMEKDDFTSSVKCPIDVIYMYAKIIPKEMGLGNSEYPEKWYFAVAGDQVVIECRPIGLNHGLYPMASAAPDFDGYSATPTSRLEILYGLQTTLDWLFSSHTANVRKAINDMLIVDPYLINMDDLKDPEPGKMIRLRRAGWGKGVENAVKQLAVQDVTKQHIGDSSYIIELMQRVSAANDSMMGMTRQSSERITATEIQGDRSSAVNRLKRMAKVINMQAMYDISYMFAAHTQQLLSNDTYVKVVGDWPDTLKDIYQPGQSVSVSPFDLMVEYDVKLRDIDQEVGGREWIDLYQILAQNPLVGQQFDMVRIFKHVATLMGAKDVNSFVMQGGNVNPQMMDDETVMKQADAGNIRPL
jgi:hypothetical protein